MKPDSESGLACLDTSEDQIGASNRVRHSDVDPGIAANAHQGNGTYNPDSNFRVIKSTGTQIEGDMTMGQRSDLREAPVTAWMHWIRCPSSTSTGTADMDRMSLSAKEMPVFKSLRMDIVMVQ